MSHTVTLAVNTFREAIRGRLLATVLGFGVAMVAASVVLAPLTLGEGVRVVRDLGLAGISLFSILTIILVGTGMVYREIEHRTIYTILSHPVTRAQFILGKFFGLYGTILFSILALSVVYLLAVGLFAGGVDATLLVALLLAALEALLVTSVAIFFSTVASPLLSALFTCLVIVAGHLLGSVRLLIEAAEQPVLGAVVEVAYRVLPSFHHFDARNNVLAGTPMPPDQLAYTLGYTLLYSAAVLVVTVVVFHRRDFD